MSRNTSISLGDHYTGFVARQLAEGRYGSASEVVRAGLRLLEDHETRLAALRAALAEGEVIVGGQRAGLWGLFFLEGDEAAQRFLGDHGIDIDGKIDLVQQARHGDPGQIVTNLKHPVFQIGHVNLP